MWNKGVKRILKEDFRSFSFFRRAYCLRLAHPTWNICIEKDAFNMTDCPALCWRFVIHDVRYGHEGPHPRRWILQFA
jgi:hypothetical protein